MSGRRLRFWKSLCAQNTLRTLPTARTWAVLLPRPGKRLGIAPSFPQIWALSPGLPTDWALPRDTGDCLRGLAHLQQRPLRSTEPLRPFSSDPPVPPDATFGLAVSSPLRAPRAPALRLRAPGYFAASPQACCRVTREQTDGFFLGGCFLPKHAPLCMHSANN